MEQSNSSYQKCQEELQQCRQKYAKEMQERDNALSMLIEKSIDIKSSIQSINEKASNQFQSNKASRKSNISEHIQELELQIQNMMDSKSQDQNIIEIKNHLIDLYQRVGINLLKKHLVFCEKLHSQNSEWQETCDQLINENQSLKEDREKSDNETSIKIKTLTEQLNELKTDHYNVVRANEESTEKLKSEISNSLNSHYLKNVLTSYFTTQDPTVQINLIKVVFSVMKYTEEEQKKCLEIWNENNKSMVSKLWDFGM